MDWIRKFFTSKTVYLTATALVLAGGLAIYTLDKWIMPVYTNYNQGITVPDVTKLSYEEATETLELYGLRHEILDRRAHSSYPADYIIDQAPLPRQIVKPDRKVYLTVNTAVRPTVVVPDLVNMSHRNAIIQLENYGLTPGTVSYESSRFRLTVLRQSVAPGDTVDQGTVVDITVSDGLGEEMVRVPDILGLPLPEAQQRVREAGLRLGNFVFQSSQQAAPNTILSFSFEGNLLEGGDELREGETIDLVISERLDGREVDEAGAVIDDEDTEVE